MLWVRLSQQGDYPYICTKLQLSKLSRGLPVASGMMPALFAGGGSLFAIHGDCEAYDTRTDRWHMVASMSTRRARVGVAAIGNKLYAVGG